jgi:hypothetical protein
MYFDGLNSGEVLLLGMLNALIPFLPLSLLDLSPSPFDDTPEPTEPRAATAVKRNVLLYEAQAYTTLLCYNYYFLTSCYYRHYNMCSVLLNSVEIDHVAYLTCKTVILIV